MVQLHSTKIERTLLTYKTDFKIDAEWHFLQRLMEKGHVMA